MKKAKAAKKVAKVMREFKKAVLTLRDVHQLKRRG